MGLWARGMIDVAVSWPTKAMPRESLMSLLRRLGHQRFGHLCCVGIDGRFFTGRGTVSTWIGK